MSSPKKKSTIPIAKETTAASSIAGSTAHSEDEEWVNKEWIAEGEVEKDYDKELQEELEEEEEQEDEEDNGDDMHDGKESLTKPLHVPGIADRYFDWKVCYPFLDTLFKNKDKITEEMKQLTSNWTPWPEYNLYSAKDQAGDWTVVPFVHTFPATDPSKTQWITANCEKCPQTYQVLKSIPNLRTALFSRLGPMTRISSHQGWADLANYVLRCHFPLIMPKKRMSCGMWVDGVVKYHNADNILVFDDSRMHKAFNASEEERIILIIDIMRPESIPLGRAKGGHTDDLDRFIDEYNKQLGLAPPSKKPAAATTATNGTSSVQKPSSKASKNNNAATSSTKPKVATESTSSPKKGSPSTNGNSSSSSNSKATPASDNAKSKKSPQKGSGNGKGKSS